MIDQIVDRGQRPLGDRIVIDRHRAAVGIPFSQFPPAAPVIDQVHQRQGALLVQHAPQRMFRLGRRIGTTQHHVTGVRPAAVHVLVRRCVTGLRPADGLRARCPYFRFENAHAFSSIPSSTVQSGNPSASITAVPNLEQKRRDHRIDLLRRRRPGFGAGDAGVVADAAQAVVEDSATALLKEKKTNGFSCRRTPQSTGNSTRAHRRPTKADGDPKSCEVCMVHVGKKTQFANAFAGVVAIYLRLTYKCGCKISRPCSPGLGRFHRNAAVVAVVLRDNSHC